VILNVAKVFFPVLYAKIARPLVSGDAVPREVVAVQMLRVNRSVAKWKKGIGLRPNPKLARRVLIGVPPSLWRARALFLGELARQDLVLRRAGMSAALRRQNRVRQSFSMGRADCLNHRDLAQWARAGGGRVLRR